MSLLREAENMNQLDYQRLPNYVTCRCQHCDKGIEFDASLFQAGTMITCPHCGIETVLFVPPVQSDSVQRQPKRRKIIGLICVLVLLLVSLPILLFHRRNPPGAIKALTETNSPNGAVVPMASKAPRVAKVAATTNAPREGLFGLKLGAPLPHECRVLSVTTNAGLLELRVIPPQTNTAFNTYWAKLNLTDNLVCKVYASGDGKDMVPSLFETLRQRYGTDYERVFHKTEFDATDDVKLFAIYEWRRGERVLYWELFIGSYSLGCEDKQLSNPIFPPVYPKGL